MGKYNSQSYKLPPIKVFNTLLSDKGIPQSLSNNTRGELNTMFKDLNINEQKKLIEVIDKQPIEHTKPKVIPLNNASKIKQTFVNINRVKNNKSKNNVSYPVDFHTTNGVKLNFLQKIKSSTIYKLLGVFFGILTFYYLYVVLIKKNKSLKKIK